VILPVTVITVMDAQYLRPLFLRLLAHETLLTHSLTKIAKIKSARKFRGLQYSASFICI